MIIKEEEDSSFFYDFHRELIFSIYLFNGIVYKDNYAIYGNIKK